MGAERCLKSPKSRNGVERAAILLLTLGESEAAEILKHMGAKDVQRLGRSMAELTQRVARRSARRARRRSPRELESQTSLGVGSDEFVRKVLVNALGDEKAELAHGSHPPRRPAQGPRGAQVDGLARGGRAGAQRASADHRHRAFVSRTRPGRRSAGLPAGEHALGPDHARRDARRRAALGARRARRNDGEAVRGRRQQRQELIAGRPQGRGRDGQPARRQGGQRHHDRSRQGRRAAVAEASRT